MTKHLTNILLIIMLGAGLASCTPSNSGQINSKAEKISREQIGLFQATQTEIAATMQAPLTSQEPFIYSGADTHQSITIKGYELDTIDPIYATGSERMIAYASLFGLTRVDTVTGVSGPGLAKTWEVSDDGLTWTFHLAEDVSWVFYNPNSNKVEQVKAGGQVRYVQAKDVVYGINRVLDLETNSDNAPLFMNLFAEFGDNSTGRHTYAVKAIDPYTLQINLLVPIAYIESLAELPIMSAQPEWLISEYGEDWMDAGVFQGYGPYIIKDWDAGEYLTLIRNPYWIGTESIPAASIETITFQLSSNEDPLIDFSTNKLDFVLLSSGDIDPAKQDNSINEYLVSKIRSCVRVLGFNTHLSPVDSPRVRQALAMAIDQQAIVGLSESDYRPAQGLMIPGSRGAPIASSSTDNGIKYDPPAALNLLLKVYNDPMDMPEIEITIPDITAYRNLANAIKQSWTESLNMQVAVSKLTSSEYSTLLFSDNPPMVWLNSFCLDYNDAGNIFYYELFRNSNRALSRGWENMELSDLIDRILKENDISKRAALYFELEENFKSENTYLIPLFWFSRTYLVQPNLHRSYPVVDGLEQFEKWLMEK
jgi:oligopeptide transport system substrate-binding protein